VRRSARPMNHPLFGSMPLAPAFVRIEGLVLLEENVKITFERDDSVFDVPYSSSARDVQRYWNMMTVDQFYFVELDVPCNTLSNTRRLMQLVQHFWSNRLREIFPDEEFIFDISETGFFDENGLCLTFYQESAGALRAPQGGGVGRS
ncbi:MAG: hypothetical protein ACLFVJ_11095, partial [Persicimonas sp.]